MTVYVPAVELSEGILSAVDAAALIQAQHDSIRVIAAAARRYIEASDKKIADCEKRLRRIE